MNIDIVTLFPEICKNVMSIGIMKKSLLKKVLDINYHQLRDFSDNKHKRIDDTPYGGGGGMIIKPQPIYDCFKHIVSIRKVRPYLIFMSPRGRVFNQKIAKELTFFKNITFMCGRYEGIDERVIEEIADEQISIGDYVISGGELPALIIIDAVVRLLPNVLSKNTKKEEESHFRKLLEFPQYTKPKVWHNREVPEILLTGNHEKIKKWKKEESINYTKKNRPDLLS
ncbi:MAG: tRNA (guanosine(37)-N1)-methyltransferase TrmD [Candidatus Improbicoccus pseudotrichonymphae]|uniref:tRNA (guanine-N(1)-)-methyltransferase n=1 Tax=Candidatus Improbicoccus pseudotrichonymphae TaxID=3033792 RepID=A0AA48I7M0_9FIRM|nr:MAG: tRNA (guanosine(37)-N1)-methyltransferase TrmD [Candidatus Improbicoccus pseudotrichonymphae]